jgi:hypothetical protein
MARGIWGDPDDDHPLDVQIRYTLNGVRVQNGFKLRDNTITPIDLQDCADEVQAWVTASFRTILTTLDIIEGVDVLDMVTGEAASTAPANQTGTIAYNVAGTIPRYVTAPVSFKGPIRRRYGRGGMLLPVRSEDWNDEGRLNVPGRAALQSVVDSMVSTFMGSGDYKLIVAHGVIPAKAATPTAPARAQVEPTWYDVESIRLNSELSFLRSRKR